MQDFIDSASGALYAFEDDVLVTDTDGVYSFSTADGVALNVPTTLKPFSTSAPSHSQIAEQEAAAAWAAYQSLAVAALTQSDQVILRCYENAVTVPRAWMDYRKALRVIIDAPSGDPTQKLPSQPAYPAGT